MNEGYYLQSNIFDKKKCLKCKVEGCKKCDNIYGTCQECKLYYEPIINQSPGLITNCKLQCELGINDKCLTCELKKEKNLNVLAATQDTN